IPVDGLEQSHAPLGPITKIALGSSRAARKTKAVATSLFPCKGLVQSKRLVPSGAGVAFRGYRIAGRSRLLVDMDRSRRLPTSRKRLLSALPRPYVRLSTGRLVSQP